MATNITAQFRADSGRYPGAPSFARLIANLNEISEEFKSWWAEHDVKSTSDGHKIVYHPTLGDMHFQHITLSVPINHDQKVVICTCSPETARLLNRELR